MTSHAEFLNDIAEVMRLYLDIVDIQPVDSPPELFEGDVLLSVEAERFGGHLRAHAECSTAKDTAVYAYSLAAAKGGELCEKRYMKRCVKIAAFRAMGKLFSAHLPWGSLTGIRPTRLLRELMDEKGERGALDFMREEFDVSPEKLRLAREIVAAQAPIMESGSPLDVDVYIGIPYCKTRCLYCSFASDVRTAKTDMEGYLAALMQDIRLGAAIAQESGYRIRSMYMGGGTPTVLTAKELERVLSCALEAYGGFGRELTVEAGRPDTITREKLELMRDMGAGRISINPQTMSARTLELIGRSHAPEDIIAAYAMAREVGFDCINMDVIAGLPGETVEDMRHTLCEIAKLAPQNLTVHTLAVKRSSRLKRLLDEIPLTPAETVDEMTAMGAAAAKKLGMTPYYMYRQKYMRGNLENVGYAMPGTECIYNVDMMEETTSIMAHGAGAMTKRIFGGEQRVERVPNPKDVPTYIAKVEAVAAQKRALYAREDGQ